MQSPVASTRARETGVAAPVNLINSANKDYMLNQIDVTREVRVNPTFNENRWGTVSAMAEHPDNPNLTASFEVISPDFAKRMLDVTTANGFENRRMKTWKVDQYARDIEAGRWANTNQSIGLTSDGSVIDGQHRLHAIIKTGIPVTMLVVRGLTQESFSYIDLGIARTVADHFRHVGKKNVFALSGAGKLLAMHINGGMQKRWSEVAPTNAEALAAVECFDNTDFWNEDYLKRSCGSKHVRPTIGIALTVLAETYLKTATRQKLLDFWSELEGKKLPASVKTASHVYRNRFSSPEARRSLGTHEQIRAFAHAIASYCNDREISVFRIPTNLPDFLKQ